MFNKQKASATAATYLKLGSFGEQVTYVQTMVIALCSQHKDIVPVSNTAIFDTVTVNAVKGFQSNTGLPVTGVVDSPTLSLLESQYAALSTAIIYPGTPLTLGSDSVSVLTLQQMLDALSTGYYNAIPRLTKDGKYGNNTKNAVILFQQMFNLKNDGITGKDTRYTIVGVYDRMNMQMYNDIYLAFGSTYRSGSSGNAVRVIQNLLNSVQKFAGVGSVLTVDGEYGSKTAAQVKAFQNHYGLTADGVVGTNTWNMMTSVYDAII